MKEEFINCERCGKLIKKKNSKHKYCTKCGNIVNRENVIERRKQK